MVETTMYMDTFNTYNRLQQELTFLEQKYAYFLNQRYREDGNENYDEKDNAQLDNSEEKEFLEKKYAYILNNIQLDKSDEKNLETIHDTTDEKVPEKLDDKPQKKRENERNEEWMNDFIGQLVEFGLDTNQEKIKKEGLMGTLSLLKEDEIVKILNAFFWTENKRISEENEENLNNIFLSGFLSDINRYKSVKKQIDDLLSNEEMCPIITRMSKLVKKDLIATLKGEKSLFDFREGKEMVFEGEKRFSRSRRRGAEDRGDSQGEMNKRAGKKELHEKFTTSILTFHEIEKLYQKYNYVFTLRDLQDTHTILRALRKGEMVLMTGDTGSGKTELGLLIANIYLDEIYKEKERQTKRPILVTGNSDTDFSDLTVEKVITSKNSVSEQNDAIVGDIKEKGNAENVLSILLKEKEVRDSIINSIDEQNYSEEKKEELKKKLMNFDMFKYNIFTEYHLQGIIKAMKEGVPLILDEINGIPPEVLLGLNHYFTRKVGEEISIGNGFDPIRIKEGFCIICTGNDKDENSKIARYQGRFGIDESLLNRMQRICKGYYNQTTEKENYKNLNNQLNNEESGSEVIKSQIDYMNENELYGVILMLCFYDEDKSKRTKKTKRINEISESTLLKKMIDTETVGFNIMKKSFRDKELGVEQAKQQTFKELNSLAKFIRHVQLSYQGKGKPLGGKDVLTLEKSPFSMRQLVSIIKDWKMDTKSLWTHLYNRYIKKIPLDNHDRYVIYRIAQEVGFLDSEIQINDDPTIMQELTEKIEKDISAEYHDGANTRDAHIEEVTIDDSLLKNNIIITKQDMYKEYFGKQFGNIDDSEFKEEIEKEKSELKNAGKIELKEDSIEVIKDRLNGVLQIISDLLANENNKYVDEIDFVAYRTLEQFCEKNEDENFIYLNIWSEESLREADVILGEIQENLLKGENLENISNLVQKLSKI